MEKMIDPKVAASVKPTFLGDTDTFAHIAGVAKKTFVLLNSKLEGGSFSLDDWEMALMPSPAIAKFTLKLAFSLLRPRSSFHGP